MLGLTLSSLVVRTPSGGYHAYFSTERHFANATALLGPKSGLDILALHGQALAPGSSINGVPYTIFNHAEIETAPEVLASLLKVRSASGRQVGEVADDWEEALAQGEHYLVHNAPLAVEGQGGQNTAYKVAAKLTRNFGLSEDAALDLLRRFWNIRCEPPWEEAELESIVSHAERYGMAARGCDTLEFAFCDIDLSAFETVTADADDGEGAPRRRRELARAR